MLAAGIKQGVKALIVVSPLSSKGGTIQRLKLWLTNLPPQSETAVLLPEEFKGAQLAESASASPRNVALYRSRFLNRWGRISILPSTAAIVRRLVEQQPDLVVSIFPWTNLAAGAAVKIARIFGGRAVRHAVHLAGDPVAPRYQADPRAVLHEKLFQVVLYTADVVIVLSESMERDLRRRFAIPSGTRIVQVPISVPLPTQQKDWSGIQHRSLVFGIVSRLDQAKGIHLALEGLSQVREHQPARLLIFGDGPYKSELQNIAAGLGLQDAVEFRGWTNDTASAMREIDCVLLPSFSEGTPRSILEAASVGVPTIATRVGGVADIVKDNLTGWLIPVGDSDALRAKMLWVAETPHAVEAAGKEARDNIERRLSHAEEISAILSS